MAPEDIVGVDHVIKASCGEGYIFVDGDAVDLVPEGGGL
jgi:hypothetical protein